MGFGCGNMCNKDVEFEQINIKIPKEKLATLEKYGQGASARREANKLKLECLKQITGKFIQMVSLI